MASAAAEGIHKGNKLQVESNLRFLAVKKESKCSSFKAGDIRLSKISEDSV